MPNEIKNNLLGTPLEKLALSILLGTIRKTKSGQKILKDIENANSPVFIKYGEVERGGEIFFANPENGSRKPDQWQSRRDASNSKEGVPVTIVLSKRVVGFKTKQGELVKSTFDEMLFHELCHAREYVLSIKGPDTVDIDGKPFTTEHFMKGITIHEVNGEIRTMRQTNKYRQEKCHTSKSCTSVQLRYEY